MPIKYNGKNYAAAYWNGVRYSEGRYNDIIVMITPDTNRYLMAKEKDVYLKAGEMNYLDYRNNPWFMSDTFSNKDIGKGGFYISFYLRPATNEYRKLFTINNFISLATHIGKNQGLIFEWLGNPVSAISTDYIASGSLVEIYREDKDSNVILRSSGYYFTLWDTWKYWEQPDGMEYAPRYASDYNRNGLTISRQWFGYSFANEGRFTLPFPDNPKNLVNVMNSGYSGSMYDDGRSSYWVQFNWDRDLRINRYRTIWCPLSSYAEDFDINSCTAYGQGWDYYEAPTVGAYYDISRRQIYNEPTSVETWERIKRPVDTASESPHSPYTSGSYYCTFQRDVFFSNPIYTRQFGVFWDQASRPTSFPVPMISIEAEYYDPLYVITGDLIAYSKDSIKQLTLQDSYPGGTDTPWPTVPYTYMTAPSETNPSAWTPTTDEWKAIVAGEGYTNSVMYAWDQAGYGTPTLVSRPLFPNTQWIGNPRFVFAGSYDAWGMVYSAFDTLTQSYFQLDYVE